MVVKTGKDLGLFHAEAQVYRRGPYLIGTGGWQGWDGVSPRRVNIVRHGRVVGSALTLVEAEAMAVDLMAPAPSASR